SRKGGQMPKKIADFNTANNREIRRLTKILRDCEVSEARLKSLQSVIENVAWMKAKLDETRHQIEAGELKSITIPYDNGGGQTGIRENPLFKGYESLWKSYMSGMEKILAALPPEAVKAEEKEDAPPKSVLDLVRAKHQKEA
ncbi:MAG: hypothetical protein J6T99_07530, partial [Oscillospiraceae bacterium]|nr:hypothetical protein [Oscillospiraceae bacterium]